jgi:hypothetical protein
MSEEPNGLKPGHNIFIIYFSILYLSIDNHKVNAHRNIDYEHRFCLRVYFHLFIAVTSGRDEST